MNYLEINEKKDIIFLQLEDERIIKCDMFLIYKHDNYEIFECKRFRIFRPGKTVNSDILEQVENALLMELYFDHNRNFPFVDENKYFHIMLLYDEKGKYQVKDLGEMKDYFESLKLIDRLNKRV